MIVTDEAPRKRGQTGLRSTEGSKQTGAISRQRAQGGEKDLATRRRGRPVGSRNKSKSLVPTELAEQMLIRFEGQIPAEHFDYLRKVIKGGGAISTERELDILILLLGRNLHPALVEELKGESEVEIDPDTGEVMGMTNKVVFRKDVTERLKVLNSLLGLRHQVEKSKDGGISAEQPLLKIVADRSLMSGGRLGILIGGVPLNAADPQITDGSPLT